ncbi:MAG: phage scaffolding protein [Anaerolineales bacterium]|nr:phage scaffolding protein [Anaerolineales bacterium]
MNKKDLEKLGFTAETLEKAGLKPEVLDEIIVLHGKDIEKHKSELVTAGEKLATVQGQLEKANEAIDSFKKLDPEGIQKAAADWESKAKEWEEKATQAAKDADEKIASMKFDAALADALKDAKVKDPADVIPHLKKDMLKLGDDGKFIGLSEQIEPLKTAKDYLFESEEPDPKIVTGGKSKNVIGDASVIAARQAAGLPVEK